MVKKIFRNTFISSLVAIVLSVGLILAVVYGYFEDRISETIKSEVNLLAKGLDYAGEQYFDNFEPSDNTRVTWIDKDGTVLYDSAADISQMDNHGQREEVLKAIEQGEAEAIRYSETLAQKTMYYAKLLGDNTIVRISYDYDTVGSIFVSMMQTIAVVILVLCIVVYIVAHYTAKAIMAPINGIDLENGKMEGEKEYEEIKPLLRRIRRQNIQIDTKVRQLKREHENRENFRREFTANVSHELKTPLTSISGISEMMINGIIRQEDIPEFAKNINKEAGRLISLVNDIILISQLESEESFLQKEQVNVVEIATSVKKRLNIAAGKRNIAMSLSVADGQGVVFNEGNNMPAIMVSGVYSMLEELIVNLCDNAVKYNREGGKVNVVIVDGQEHVKIIVEDTGIGIPDKEKTSVFERFYRVDKGRSKEVGGTGLGLSIVKHVAIYHGGRVYAEDRAGGGTRMTAEISK